MTYFDEIKANIDNLHNEGYPIDKILDMADRWLHGYGIESIRNENEWVNGYYMDIVALYVNMGNTYDTTIIYNTKENEFIISSFGEYTEQMLIGIKKDLEA